jgi:hypothetical protein
LELTGGTWDFDIVGNFRGVEEPLVSGTVEVNSLLATITPLEGGPSMYITYDQFTDYRKVFTWFDDDGTTVLDVTDARLQAKDSGNTLVLDLKWFATAPDEPTIAGLPALERGYLSPTAADTTSLEMHISNQNTIAAGIYTFDLLAKEEGGDWEKLGSGTLEVLASITDPNS